MHVLLKRTEQLHNTSDNNNNDNNNNNNNSNNNKLPYSMILTTFTCCQGGAHDQVLIQWSFHVPCSIQINQICMQLGNNFLDFQKTVYLFPYPTQLDCWGETSLCLCVFKTLFYILVFLLQTLQLALSIIFPLGWLLGKISRLKLPPHFPFLECGCVIR